MRKSQILKRLAEIKNELANEDADLDALEAEARSLKDELAKIEQRERLMNEVETRGRTARDFGEELEPEETKTRTFDVDSVEYRDAFMKKLMGRELDEEERTAVSASVAIPTHTMNLIIGRLKKNPLLEAIDITYIPSNVSFPVEGTVNDAAWVDMGTAATDSDDTLTSITLSAYKLIKTVEITADVKAMAIPAFEAWLVSRLSNRIEKTVDVSIINGTGTNQATGILKTISTTTGKWAKAGMTYADLLKVVASLPTEYANGASFVMNRTLFYTQVLGIEDTNKKPIVVADLQSPAKFNILGYPVIIDDNMPDDKLIFGDLKEYKFNFVQAPEIKANESVAFRTGSLVYRALALADGKLADIAAIKVFEKTA